MIQSHKNIFFKVADQLNCIIGVREPNRLADKWIGKRGYTPKMEKCKAKTSNSTSHDFGGLVVDPLLCPEAFTAESLSDAKDKWLNKFLSNGDLPTDFTRQTTGPEKGLVKYQGLAIHSDYDLMYVSSADAKGEHKFTEYADGKVLFMRAQGMLNRLFGTVMIQHGAELHWDGGVGAPKSEQVYIFKPKRNFNLALSSFSTDKGTRH